MLTLAQIPFYPQLKVHRLNISGVEKGYIHYCSTWALRAMDVIISELKEIEGFHLPLQFSMLG